MSWDPTQGQYPPSGGQQYPPNSQPPSGGQQYIPSGQPPNGGQDPYSGYGAQQNPYGAPPSQNPYGAPPEQNPYGAPPQYPPPNQGGYGYNVPPQQGNQPFGVMLQNLFQQYITVLTRPLQALSSRPAAPGVPQRSFVATGVQTFAEEMPKANWMMIWVQLIGLAIISEIFGLIGAAITRVDYANYGTYFAGLVGASSIAIISVPIGFFILVGIQYLLAKMFQGQGNFMTQSYTTLLFYTPIRIISAVLGIIPFVGGILGAVISIYSIILNVFQIIAVHRLSGGKATAVVLIPIVALFLLFFLCALVIVALIFAAYRSA